MSAHIFSVSPKKETLPIAMADGSRSKITAYPVDDGRRPVCILMPAMGVPASWYEPLANALGRQGIQAVTADLRGHGESSLRASRSMDFGYREMVTQDLPAVVAATAGRFPSCPLYLLGHSLGGQMSVLYASLFPGRVAGIVLVSSCSIYFRGWTFPINLIILLGTQLAWGISRLLGYYPGRRLGFGGREARTMVRDWAHNARTGRYQPANCSCDLEAALERVVTPILAIAIAGDRLAPPLAIRNLCDKLKKAPVQYLHMGVDEIPAAGQDHFAWVSHADAIVREMGLWMANTPVRLRS
ncbi:MAG: alpha/beta fold hydrolase [Desulfobacteraceae bacterium]|jgi:predicted alpha/beta hydrolase|nr:alpha/beta fold hydrolase [Desulfobacteraceae bacterium]